MLTHWLAAQDALLLRQTASSFRAALAGKVSGLFALDAALAGAPLAASALFSSVSSIVAPVGQPNYAAANAVLNAWANGRSAQACPMGMGLGGSETGLETSGTRT